MSNSIQTCRNLCFLVTIQNPEGTTPLRIIEPGCRSIVAFLSANGGLFAERKATIREPCSAKVLNGVTLRGFWLTR